MTWIQLELLKCLCIVLQNNDLLFDLDSHGRLFSLKEHEGTSNNELVSRQKSESLLLNLVERAARGSRMSWTRMRRKKRVRPGSRRSLRSLLMTKTPSRILTTRLVAEAANICAVCSSFMLGSRGKGVHYHSSVCSENVVICTLKI